MRRKKFRWVKCSLGAPSPQHDVPVRVCVRVCVYARWGAPCSQGFLSACLKLAGCCEVSLGESQEEVKEDDATAADSRISERLVDTRNVYARMWAPEHPSVVSNRSEGDYS